MDVTNRDVLGRASRGIRVELVVPKLFDPLRLFGLSCCPRNSREIWDENIVVCTEFCSCLRGSGEKEELTPFLGNDREGRTGGNSKSGIRCRKWEFFGIRFGKGLIPRAASPVELSSGGMGLLNPDLLEIPNPSPASPGTEPRASKAGSSLLESL